MRRAASSTGNPDFGGGRSQVLDGESRPEAMVTPVFTAPDLSDHSPLGTALQKMSKMKIEPTMCMKIKGKLQNVHP